MRLKTKLTILAALVAGGCASLFAGCKIGEMTFDEYLDTNGVRGQCVTYFGNGGIFNENDKEDIDVYYKPDSYIINSNTLSHFSFSRLNYTFDAWYYAEVDGDGNLVRDGEGNPVLLEKVTDTDKITSDEHLYVVANWNKNPELEIYLVTDGFDLEDSNGNTYKSGGLLKTSYSFGTLSQSQHAITSPDATFLCFYEDEECTTPVQSVSKPADVTAENTKIYAKYIEGNWTVVSTSNAVLTMLDNYAKGGNYYLFTPDGSNKITYTGRDIALKTGDCNFVLEGNGVTIENLSFKSTSMSVGNYALLGNLSEDAAIRDVCFENVSVNATVQSGTLNIYLLAYGYDGAELSGVIFDGVKFEIHAPSSANITNIDRRTDDGKEANGESWLFGGFDTDDKFIEEVGGVQIKDATLTYTIDLTQVITVADKISK